MTLNPPSSGTPVTASSQASAASGSPSTSATASPTPSRRPGRLRGRLAFVAGLLVPSLIAAMIAFIFVPLAEASSDRELIPVMGFGTVDGAEIAVTPYHRTGVDSGDTFQIRLNAVDLATGRTLWDVQLTDDLIGTAGVLAVGDNTVYVATDYGLSILSLTDGRMLAERDGIAGLDDQYLTSYSAYGYDQTRDAIITMDRSGEFFQIPVDETEAQPAPADTANTWSCVLTTGTSAWMTYSDGFVDEAAGIPRPDGSLLELRATGESAGRAPATSGIQSVYAVDASGSGAQLGTTSFFNASFVMGVTPSPVPANGCTRVTINDVPLNPAEAIEACLSAGLPADQCALFVDDGPVEEGPTKDGLAEPTVQAAGETLGFAVIQGTADINDSSVTLSILDLTTGAVTSTLPLTADIERAVVSPGGTPVLVAGVTGYEPDSLLVLEPSGALRTIDIGPRGPFEW